MKWLRRERRGLRCGFWGVSWCVSEGFGFLLLFFGNMEWNLCFDRVEGMEVEVMGNLRGGRGVLNDELEILKSGRADVSRCGYTVITSCEYGWCKCDT